MSETVKQNVTSFVSITLHLKFWHFGRAFYYLKHIYSSRYILRLYFSFVRPSSSSPLGVKVGGGAIKFVVGAEQKLWVSSISSLPRYRYDVRCQVRAGVSLINTARG